MQPMNRRAFLACAAAAYLGSRVQAQAKAGELGQGDFRYRVVSGWGVLGDETPVNNCHGIVCDREGNLILFTDHVKNNVIVYSPDGRLLHKWGTEFPGAHGLSLVNEQGRDVLYLTDLARHRVFQATTDGKILQEWDCPLHTGKYTKAEEYRPSWTLHLPEGGFYVLDGYGKDYITRYDPQGNFAGIFGGAEGDITHWGPHGGMIDEYSGAGSTLLIAMSDQQYLLRLSREGEKLQQVNLPGGNPRQIRRAGKNYFVAHLSENWPKDKAARGYVSVLDESLRVVSNVGGEPAEYGDDGVLKTMKESGGVFKHPHDLCVGHDQSLYVAQFNSGKTYPIKLERV